MLSKTLQDGLNDYGIGAKIRALRLKKKIGLVDLGKHTGLSPALLSKIERGRLFPPLPTLLRIALVFGVGVRQRCSTTATGRVTTHLPQGHARVEGAAGSSGVWSCRHSDDCT